jgi:hypothetical protein
MNTTEKAKAAWEINRLPDDLHGLAIRASGEEQAVYHNVYAAIWNEGGKRAELLPAMHDAALAMMAVVGAEECCRDSLGPRPEGTHAIAMVALHMYRFLAAIGHGNAEAAKLVRRHVEYRKPISGTLNGYECGRDYAPCVPAGYADVAKAIAEVVPEMIFGTGIHDDAAADDAAKCTE